MCIEVIGDNGIYGNFEIKKNTDEYLTRELESNDEWDGIVSPVGIRLNGSENLDGGLDVVFKDGSRNHLSYGGGYFGEGQQYGIYVWKFERIMDIGEIESVIINEQSYKLKEA